MQKPEEVSNESWALCKFLNACMRVNLLSDGKEYFKDFPEARRGWNGVWQIDATDLNRLVREALDGQNQRILSRVQAKGRRSQALFSLEDARVINSLGQVGDMDLLVEMVYEK